MTEDSLTLDSHRFDRVYIYTRFGVLFIMLTWSVWAAISHADDVIVPLAFAAGFLFALVTAAAMSAMRIKGVQLRRVLLWVAGFDLVALGMLAVALQHYQDPIYPTFFTLPALYALFIRRRETWIVGLAAAFVYLLVHTVSVETHEVFGYSIVVGKAVQLVVVTAIFAATSESLLRHQRQLELKTELEIRLNAQMQHRLTELQAISQITEVIHSSLDFDRVGPLVLDVLMKVLNIPACSLFVIDKVKAETHFSATVGFPGVSAGHAPRFGTGYQGIEPPDEHFSCIDVVDYKQMMVVFCADNSYLENMADADRLVLQAVASELVVAVENSQLYKLTRRMAITDELTGLHNYRFLQQRLEEEIERAKRYGKDLSLLMIDVDDFKQFNDSNNHITGDRALADLGEVMHRIVRDVDVVCRYGGEEFSVLLPETDAAGAFVVAEKLRETIARHRFLDIDGEPTGRLTVSIGLAAYPAHAGDKETLLRMADDSLYQAKHGGKDRVRSPRSHIAAMPPVSPAAD